MPCSQPATLASTAPAYQQQCINKVTQNSLTICWQQFENIAGYIQVAGTLSWPPAATTGGQPTSGYYLLTIRQDGFESTEYIAGESSTQVPILVPQGMQIYFSVAACYNSNIPPSGSGCPVAIGNITATAPHQ
jgi:hypothetical protein